MSTDVQSAILGASLSLAGLLLVFAGFLASRADRFDSTKRAVPYSRTAKYAAVPFFLFMAIALVSIRCLENESGRLCPYVSPIFQFAIVLTGLYGFVTILKTF